MALSTRLGPCSLIVTVPLSGASLAYRSSNPHANRTDEWASLPPPSDSEPVSYSRTRRRLVGHPLYEPTTLVSAHANRFPLELPVRSARGGAGAPVPDSSHSHSEAPPTLNYAARTSLQNTGPAANVRPVGSSEFDPSLHSSPHPLPPPPHSNLPKTRGNRLQCWAPRRAITLAFCRIASS